MEFYEKDPWEFMGRAEKENRLSCARRSAGIAGPLSAREAGCSTKLYS